jgi:fatty-acid desaturase
LFLISPKALLFLYFVPLGSAHLVGAIHQVTSHRGGFPRNLPWLELVLPTGGEWLHKNHHDKPWTMSFKSKNWQLDPGALFIKIIKV